MAHTENSFCTTKIKYFFAYTMYYRVANKYKNTGDFNLPNLYNINEYTSIFVDYILIILNLN